MFLNHRHTSIADCRKVRPVRAAKADGVPRERGFRVRSKRVRACLVLLSNSAVSKLTQESREAAISLPIVRSPLWRRACADYCLTGAWSGRPVLAGFARRFRSLVDPV